MPKDSNTAKGTQTSTLLRRIFKANNLNSFMDENERELSMSSFTEHIEKLCEERSIIRREVIERAGIERSFGYQLFRGARKPSRDNVIRLAFGFGLDVEETQSLLKTAGKATLYPRIKRDAIILFCLSHKQTILEVQDSLHSHGLTLLGSENYESNER